MISGEHLEQLLSTTAMPAAPTLEPSSGPTHQPMDDAEFEAAVRRLIENARSLMDSDALAPLDRAWRYYNGSVDQTPMGKIGQDVETGEDVYEGSRAVLTECRDQVQTLLPEIYRSIAGSEEAVIFKPNGPEDTAHVEQANDYVRHIFWDKNDGEALVKDGLLEWMVKYCAYRVWRENSHKEHVKTIEADETQLFVLQQDPNLVIEQVEPFQITFHVPQLQPDGSTISVPQQQTMYRLHCRYYEPVGKTRVELIPQDEVLIDLEAQAMDQATVWGIDAERRVSDLIALGLDPDVVRQSAGKGLRRGGRSPSVQRHRANVDRINRASRDHPDDSLWWVRTVDARVLVDRDGDGIAEPWRIIAVGEPLEIVEAVEDPGSDTIVVGSPLPRPHYLLGEGIVENTMDLQEISTSLMRRTLDNFARSIDPRIGVRGGSETVFDDLDSWHANKLIDLGRDGALDIVQIPFNGAAALPLIQKFEERRTLRTGISPAAQGLDPNALKGQTVEGAGAIVAAPQSRAEGYAREFASRIMKEIFRAILRITVAYQDRPEVIRLRNDFVSVDPRGWNVDMDVAVHIGTGTRQERIAALLAIIAKQEQLFAAKSKLFDLKKYRQALGDLAHEMGVKDEERYFPEVDDEMIAQVQKEAQQERQQQMQDAVAMQQAVEQAKQGAKAQAEIAVAEAESRLEQAAKEREQALKARFESDLLAQKQAGEAQLLRLEAMLEAMVAKHLGKGAGGARSNANLERRA